ncbi:geranylgeranylglycerol-phosphate geranylgeranyltransferase [Compostibacter hankyongensis]|uniref:Geranylgeranylglycerol-phosphate geranylgeranyltransferase n=1 Tax=Compostibacter hankyongensis TaxID=1007089 RepID=A0ABP8FVW7_9BACT
MNPLSAFLKLIRYPNLIYIFLTQYLLQYAVIRPVYLRSDMQATLGHGAFFLLSLATVLIAAAGYIINDYFDVNIDQINKPDKIIIDKYISRRWAMLWHTLLNVAGVGLGFAIAWSIGRPLLGFTQLMCTGLLWFYSTAYKRQLLIGNVVISLLTALTVMVVGFYEPQLYSGVTPQSAVPAYLLLRVILAYAVFAFLLSLVREMVKDLEDIKGDDKEGCRTFPIVYGVNASKDFAAALLWLLIAAIVYAQFRVVQWGWYAAAAYLLVLVQLPAAAVIYRLRRASGPAGFHRVSNLIKLVMLTGILSMLFFKIHF